MLTTKEGNPFKKAPTPNPCHPLERGPELFTEEALANRLAWNAAWLQFRPRTSYEIEEGLFPAYIPAGCCPKDARITLNYALWDAGYTPSSEGDNPTWRWTEGV